MTYEITAQDILEHPRFLDARTAHIDALVALFRADRFVLSMMADAGVIVLRAYLVSLHIVFDPKNRATWATSGNLKNALVERGLASPRRVDHLLAAFRQAGYVEPRPSPDDRRITIFDPTEQLIAHDRAHLAAYHRFLLDLYPGRGYEWTLSDDVSAHGAIRREVFRDQPRATTALQHNAIRLFLARDAGYLAFLLVAQAQISDAAGLTWSSMSDDLGVARSHLRTLFAEAEAAGYVRLQTGSRRPVEILPALWDAYHCFLAEVQADQDALAQSAFEAMSHDV